MRFSEALALTPKDFDFAHQVLSVNKTWDYKGKGGFLPTKNKSSVRKIQIDWQTVIRFSELIKGLPENEPIFVKGQVYNSTVNTVLSRCCHKAKVPEITVHGIETYACFSVTVCRCFYCKCCKKTWTCQYDDYAENIFTYYSGT